MKTGTLLQLVLRFANAVGSEGVTAVFAYQMEIRGRSWDRRL